MYNLSIFKYHNYRYLPTKKLIEQVCKAAIIKQYTNIFIAIAIVNITDSQKYNNMYRQKNYPTNVISLEYPDTVDSFNHLFGEIILCNDIIVNEAHQQNKSIVGHYLHMLIHGMLHIQGYDHQNDNEAEIMEELEISILAKFGYSNPYKG